MMMGTSHHHLGSTDDQLHQQYPYNRQEEMEWRDDNDVNDDDDDIRSPDDHIGHQRSSADMMRLSTPTPHWTTRTTDKYYSPFCSGGVPRQILQRAYANRQEGAQHQPHNLADDASAMHNAPHIREHDHYSNIHDNKSRNAATANKTNELTPQHYHSSRPLLAREKKTYRSRNNAPHTAHIDDDVYNDDDYAYDDDKNMMVKNVRPPHLQPHSSHPTPRPKSYYDYADNYTYHHDFLYFDPNQHHRRSVTHQRENGGHSGGRRSYHPSNGQQQPKSSFSSPSSSAVSSPRFHPQAISSSHDDNSSPSNPHMHNKTGEVSHHADMMEQHHYQHQQLTDTAPDWVARLTQRSSHHHVDPMSNHHDTQSRHRQSNRVVKPSTQHRRNATPNHDQSNNDRGGTPGWVERLSRTRSAPNVEQPPPQQKNPVRNRVGAFAAMAPATARTKSGTKSKPMRTPSQHQHQREKIEHKNTNNVHERDDPTKPVPPWVQRLSATPAAAPNHPPDHNTVPASRMTAAPKTKKLQQQQQLTHSNGSKNTTTPTPAVVKKRQNNTVNNRNRTATDPAPVSTSQQHVIAATNQQVAQPSQTNDYDRPAAYQDTHREAHRGHASSSTHQDHHSVSGAPEPLPLHHSSSQWAQHVGLGGAEDDGFEEERRKKIDREAILDRIKTQSIQQQHNGGIYGEM